MHDTTFRQACWLLAERRLTHVLAGGRFVAHRQGWLETVAAGIANEHAIARIPAELDTAQAIADYLEPEDSPYIQARARAARAHWDNWRCKTCDGTGWTWHPAGVVPCLNCDKVGGRT